MLRLRKMKISFLTKQYKQIKIQEKYTKKKSQSLLQNVYIA